MTEDNHSDHQHHSEHHVHFDQTLIKDDFEEDNSIVYQKGATGNTITVHLGFLQMNHRYQIELRVPVAVFNDLNADRLELAPDEAALPNVNCRLIAFEGKKSDKSEHVDLRVEFLAHKEKLLKEDLRLANVNKPDEKVRFILAARVLGRGKGTPMLRNGIHCIGIEADEESEASDWQGFSRNDKDEI